MQRPRFLFNATGTHGDLLPVLATAEALLRRGASCHVLASESMEKRARERGIPFTAVAPAQSQNLCSVEENFSKFAFPGFRPTQTFVERELRRHSNLVLVNLSPTSPTTSLAERHGLALCRLELSPYRIPSLVAPHYPLSARLDGPDGPRFRQVELPRLQARRYAHPFIVEGVNRFRADLGLEPVETTRSLERWVQRRIGFFPAWFCAPAPDWPANLELVGFPLPRASSRLPESVQSWLSRHPLPIVCTPGTGVRDPESFFESCRRAAEALDRPAIMLSPHAPRPPESSLVAVLTVDYLDLAALLPSAALLVHHGGIGTTARALEAGIPQVIVPRAFDQPDNGHRIWRLEVGSMIAASLLSGKTLARVARPLLECPRLARKLQRLQRRVRGDHAVERAADSLLHHFGTRRAPAPSLPTPEIA